MIIFTRSLELNYKNILIISFILLIFCLPTGCNKNNITIKPGKFLNIPISEITETVNFIPAIVDEIYMEVITVKASDDSIRIAFNTCERCHRSGKGYFLQEENEVICQQCQMSFSIDSISILSGGCQPIPITQEEITITDKFIRISYDILSANTHWFTDWKQEESITEDPIESIENPIH